MWIEVSFNTLYLIVVWALVVLMTRRLGEVSKENYPVANRLRWAFVLLALGDSGHVGFRVAAYALGGVEANPLLLGIGTLATAITVTFFYVVMLDIWRLRFNKKYGLFEYGLLALVPIRLIVMALPGNDWGSPTPPEFFGLLRNVFLILFGIGILYLYLRDAIKSKDRLFRWIAYCVFFSYLFFTPVILWATQIPLLGMLMIPKTVMYVAVAVLAYYGLWPQKKVVAAPLPSSAD